MLVFETVAFSKPQCPSGVPCSALFVSGEVVAFDAAASCVIALQQLHFDSVIYEFM